MVSVEVLSEKLHKSSTKLHWSREGMREGIFKPRKRQRKRAAPSEQSEHVKLAAWLDGVRGLVWTTFPLGGVRSRAAGASLKAAGVKSGVPDVLIFTPPPARHDVLGVAVELKRLDGVPSDVQDNQLEWMDKLRSVGWHATVAYGWRDAVVQLESLGYRAGR